MKQNKYDNHPFFQAYAEMDRSKKGLEAAGEWHILKEMLPEFKGKKVLDLGCGFGWHSRYAREQGAESVIGTDISERMLERAIEMTHDSGIVYLHQAIEDMDFTKGSMDIVISSLALHYIESFSRICEKINTVLKPGGSFVFSVEHPIFTARKEQDWIYDHTGKNPIYWPVDNYQVEGKREASFLNETVIKFHRTVSTFMNDLIQAGFDILRVEESVPSKDMLEKIPDMKHELRRPMFLMIAAEKKDVKISKPKEI
ncbi:class I SAM-dependent methyltransferase [Oceanobacillus jeddahense]|uniref:Class I SAM-dependent methyltransferase n=1 Tax=Oceanobacillus jeddahense TaxID=1462527 RepID=A0ABY5JUN3_9BACI|nr:class I SAM-dependent methyltransferase [Oceanobacillus jeddahense]UUI03869.1 class I SAM-dependent methyltransferase [Oceanobacillus jeddahense]